MHERPKIRTFYQTSEESNENKIGQRLVRFQALVDIDKMLWSVPLLTSIENAESHWGIRTIVHKMHVDGQIGSKSILGMPLTKYLEQSSVFAYLYNNLRPSKPPRFKVRQDSDGAEIARRMLLEGNAPEPMGTLKKLNDMDEDDRKWFAGSATRLMDRDSVDEWIIGGERVTRQQCEAYWG